MSKTLEFQRPNRVTMEEVSGNSGVFVFKPLEPGYGVTIGNSIRRILLSSLEGYAITGINIPGVLHEFSTLQGVVEDVSQIVLNLKQVRFKSTDDATEGGRLAVHISKQEVFTAGDIGKATSEFEILNPDLVICTMAKNVDFSIEVDVKKGRGYVPYEENKQEEEVIGYIPIDSIFTPIFNVQFRVENTRVRQKTDYEKLILEVETDGSIHPKDALKGAAEILIQHFMLFSEKNIFVEEFKEGVTPPVDEQLLHMRKILNTNIDALKLSVRALNCLKTSELNTLGDLVSKEVSEMLKFRNFGKKSMAELQNLVESKGLHFGMDLSKYQLKEEES